MENQSPMPQQSDTSKQGVAGHAFVHLPEERRTQHMRCICVVVWWFGGQFAIRVRLHHCVSMHC